MRKRIIALNGGLGNQMFQYAFARMLEDRKHCLIEFDTGFYSTVNDRKLAIQNYNIHKYDFCNHEYYNKIRLLFQKIPFVAWLAGTYKEYSEYQLGVEFYSKLYKPKQILLQYQQLQEMKQKTGTIPPCHLQALKMEHG